MSTTLWKTVAQDDQLTLFNEMEMNAICPGRAMRNAAGGLRVAQIRSADSANSMNSRHCIGDSPADGPSDRKQVAASEWCCDGAAGGVPVQVGESAIRQSACSEPH
jgi:hypothetical protein